MRAARTLLVQSIMKDLFIEELVTILGGAAPGSSGPIGLNGIREDVGPSGDPGIGPDPGPWAALSGPGSHLAIHEGQVRGL